MDIEKLKLQLQTELDRIHAQTKATRTEEMLHFLDGKDSAFRAVLRWLNEAPSL